MAERYNKLYSLPGNLYAAGSPVVISAGVLLKDNQSGKVLCQLKFRNISDKVINALKLLVVGYDMSGDEVCREEHQYLDLNVSRNGSFGAKEAIPLPEHSVRSYTANVTAVYFSDGSRYFADDSKWETLPEPLPLRTRLFDRELIRQYKLDTTDSSEYVPMEYKDLWVCTCGELNHLGDSCFHCSQELDNLKKLLNVDTLLEEKNLRLMEEAKKAAERESSREHSAKIIKRVLMVIVPLLVAAGAVFFFYSRSQQRDADYEMAGVLLASEKYAEAAEAYEALGNYKDSAEKASQARATLSELNSYDRALKFLENGRYDDAYDAFLAMGNYQDAAELAKEALYRKALSFTESGDCLEAQALFKQLGDYKDSARLCECFVELLVLEETSYNEECDGPLTTTYSYDSSGRVSVKTQLFSVYPNLNDRVLEYSYNEDGSYTETEYNTVRSYDPYGNFIGQGDVISYIYDYGYYDDGTLNYWGAYSAEDESFVCETVYDEQGNRIRYTGTDGSVETTTNGYDENGLLVKQENFDPNGAFVDRTSFEYDESGKLKRSTYMDLNNVTAVTTYSYEIVYVPDTAE